jgi:hypothetical protein
VARSTAGNELIPQVLCAIWLSGWSMQSQSEAVLFSPRAARALFIRRNTFSSDRKSWRPHSLSSVSANPFTRKRNYDASDNLCALGQDDVVDGISV